MSQSPAGAADHALSEGQIHSLEIDPAAAVASLGLRPGDTVNRASWPAFIRKTCVSPRWPAVIHARQDGSRLIVVAQLDDATLYLQGHFPGEPILPGVAQLNWAIEAGIAVLGISAPFAGVDGLKFQNIMRPGDHFTLEIESLEEQQRLRFKYRFGTVLYSQGRVRFGRAQPEPTDLPMVESEPGLARVAIVIPHYNHHRQFRATLARIRAFGLTIMVIDDGSEENSRAALRAMLAETPATVLLEHEQNQGKGGAIISGLRAAAERGYSHVLQIDADGQHRIEDAPKLLDLARCNPNAIISALPVFSDDVPRERLLGRRVTIFFNRLETLSNRIRDAMCGLRVYPVGALLDVLARTRIGRRMQFDIQVLVEADWAGIPIAWVESPVTYPDDGLSHFHYLRDNVGIVLMHTMLLFRMLPRIPSLLRRHHRPPALGSHQDPGESTP